MTRSLVLISLLVLFGCSTRARPLPTAGGCAAHDEAACKSDSACRADYCAQCSCQSAFAGCSARSDAPATCPVSACPASDCGCSGLGELDCIAAQAHGCVAAYCPNTCSSTNYFASCLGPSDPAPPCGGTGGCGSIETCRTAADCPGSNLVCDAPDSAPSCGDCGIVECGGDSDCGAGQVCSYSDCCHGNQCLPACASDSDCADGQECHSDGHCRTITCNLGGCPAEFDCVNGLCQRNTCVADEDCGSGFCVVGGCYTRLGSCGVQ